MGRTQILVIGNNDSECEQRQLDMAYRTGQLIAEQGAVLVTGGMGGVMMAASHGCKDAGGITLGILPHNDPKAANQFCDIVVPTGVGLMRDFINVHSADGIIVIGGGVGTLSEMCAAYMYNKPMVAIVGSGGMADRFAGKYLDHRRRSIIRTASSAAEAVKEIFCIIGSADRHQAHKTTHD